MMGRQHGVTQAHKVPTESRHTHHTVQNELGWLTEPRLRIIRPQLSFVGANQAIFAVNEVCVMAPTDNHVSPPTVGIGITARV